MTYYAIAFYYFSPIKNPHDEIKKFKKFFENKDYKGRIYISEEGINAQLSAPFEETKAFDTWLKEDSYYQNVLVKLQETHDQAFCKMTVKYREQLCAFDEKVDFTNVGEHLSPEKWDEMLSNKGEETKVLDVRNNYESDVGHFEGAIKPDLKTFREFPAYADELKKQMDPEKDKLMMYCTGGIRCEYYSSYLKKQGFKNIYQLDGGVINYGNKRGSKHWNGKLFVFDDRLVAPISEDNIETISKCKFCEASSDTYYNCANMDCNELFLSCPECAKEQKGLCCTECESGRVRPFDDSEKPKPFRKYQSA